MSELKYSKAEYEFVCSLIWGSVPVDRKAAEELPMFKTSEAELLKKYPKLDKSFHEENAKLYGLNGVKKIMLYCASADIETSVYSKYSEPVLMEAYIILFDQPDAEGNVYKREHMTPKFIGTILPKENVRGFSIDDKGLKIIMPIK